MLQRIAGKAVLADWTNKTLMTGKDIIKVYMADINNATLTLYDIEIGLTEHS